MSDRRVLQCRSIVLLPLVMLLGTGCYRYVPVDRPQLGSDVRARLTTDAAVRRSAGLDEPMLFVSGTVVRVSPESMTVNVLLMRDPSVFRDIEIRDTVNVALDEVQFLAERQISTGRSLLFAGALGAGAYLLVRGIGAIVGGNEGEDEGKPNVVVVPATHATVPRYRPILRFSIPW
jgi:hypothetical protein